MINNSAITKKTPSKINYYLASISFLIGSVGLIYLRLLFALGLFDSLSDGLIDFLASFLIQGVFIFGGGFFVLFIHNKLYNKNPLNQERKTLKSRFIDLGFKLPRIYIIPLSFLLGILFFIMSLGISYINTLILLILGYNFPATAPEAVGGVGYFLLALFNSAVMPAFCEEFLSRGLILRGLKDTMRERTAIIFSAVLFGLMHANIRQTLYTMVGGIFLALITLRTKSIYPAMIIHFMNNAISVYSTHASANGWVGGNWGDFIANNFLLSILIWIVATVALILIIYYIIKKEAKFNAEKEKQESNQNEKNQEVTLYQTPFGINFVQKTPLLYKPKLQDNIMMMTSTFLLTLTTFLTLFMGMF